MTGEAGSWTGFRLETFGEPYLVWHDGPDLGPLLARWRTEPLFVETALLDGLGERDPLAATAIAALPLDGADRSRLADILESHLGLQPAAFHLRVAQALRALACDERWTAEICRVLLGAGLWTDRLDAAVVLGGLRPEPAVVEALALGMRDPEYLVRHHATIALLGIAGIEKSRLEYDAALARIRGTTTPSDWDWMAAELEMTAKALIDA